jgi:hypothetical protein
MPENPRLLSLGMNGILLIGGIVMDKIIEVLNELIKDSEIILGGGLRELKDAWAKTYRWEDRCKDLLAQYISDKEAQEFEDEMGEMNMMDQRGNLVRHIKAKNAFLVALREDIIKNPDYWKDKLAQVQETVVKEERYKPLGIVTRICDRFHLVARQLRDRHDNRQTLEIEDEYDVQDLMHSLLKLFFDDIRPEEWTPSYAGGSARMDFLLKNERLVVETKKTRKGLTAKELGNQLIVDIDRYKQHPDCKTLFCFVYDPDGRIPNPKGIENDLSHQNGELEVKVFIAPKGY